MFNNFFNLKDNIYFNRIFSIRGSIYAYSLSSFIDIILILLISEIFRKITDISFDGSIYLLILQCLLFIIIRTFFVFCLRRYSFNKIFRKKFKDEELISKEFIDNRINDLGKQNDVDLFKEKLINSCNLAAVNFDIPVASICAEIIFALGGLIILLKIFGFKIFFYNLPVLILLLVCSKLISNKLRKLGSIILISTEKRLKSIDNVSEISYEISALNQSSKLVDYFSMINNPHNKIMSQQIITSNMNQIYTESSAFIMILTSLVFINLNIAETSLTNSVTSLAILSRMIPSFTRSIAFITQLQFGSPCVRRLAVIKNF